MFVEVKVPKNCVREGEFICLLVSNGFIHGDGGNQGESIDIDIPIVGLGHDMTLLTELIEHCSIK